jgi:hypothetical protein
LHHRHASEFGILKPNVSSDEINRQAMVFDDGDRGLIPEARQRFGCGVVPARAIDGTILMWVSILF